MNRPTALSISIPLSIALINVTSAGVVAQPTITSTTQLPSSPRPGKVDLDQHHWTHVGGSAMHTGSTMTHHAIGAHLSAARWTSIGDGDQHFEFTPQASIVVDDLHVYAIGIDGDLVDHLIAFDRESGDLVWSAEVDFALLDSWSTPTIDMDNDSVIHGSGYVLSAHDRFDGSMLWELELDVPIVNASPCVTDDLGDSDRVFITDYSFGASSSGSLLCVNIDPFDASTNPYEPGEVVWEVSLPGDCSGNTPAYDDGVVYVSTADNGSGGSGHVLAFDASSTDAPQPIWDVPNPEPHGFFGGPSLSDDWLYISSYNFNGGQRSANTIKLNKDNGNLIWSIPTVRTNASPMVLPNGHIVVSGGVPPISGFFYGAAPSIELIQDLGASANFLWDSFEETFIDSDNSGGFSTGDEYLSIGGWGHHPAYIQVQHTPMLVVGTMETPTFNDPLTHGESIHTIDLSKHPSDPGFIVSTRTNAGTSPAVVGGSVLTTSDVGISRIPLRFTPSPVSPRERLIEGLSDFKSSSMHKGVLTRP